MHDGNDDKEGTMGTWVPLDEITNDNLIHVDVMAYRQDEYLNELARVLRVIGANVMTGIDLEYWHDRENHIREMRDMAFPKGA